MDARAKAIIAHLTIVGWIISLVINLDKKDEFASFFLRQALGLFIVGFAVSLIPIIKFFLILVVFAFWLLSFIYAIQGQQKTIPFGHYFQQWFKDL